MLVEDSRIAIRSDADVVAARRRGRVLAQQIGFSSGEGTLLATAISELARNIVKYAETGEIVLGLANGGRRQGIVVIARDEGPGIPDVAQAMRDGFSTSQGLGLGLPGARRLVDEFDIVSTVGKGTTVTLTKWLT